MDIAKGVIVNQWAFYQAKLEGRIVYPSGNRLVYSPASGGGSLFDYSYNNRTLRLNDFVGENWAIYPAESKFQVQLRRDGQVLPKPEIHFAVIYICSVPGLSDDELSLFPALHEVGHAVLLENLYSCLEDASYAFRDHDSYTQKLINTQRYFSQQNPHFQKYDERFAWKFALALQQKLELLPSFSRDDLEQFYLPLLGSYGSDFLNPQHDQFLGEIDPWERIRNKFRF